MVLNAGSMISRWTRFGGLHSALSYSIFLKPPWIKVKIVERPCPHFKTTPTNYHSKRYFNVSRYDNAKKRDPLAMVAPTLSRTGSEKLGIGAYFQLVIPISTFCLGVWQVYRWFWKLDLIEAMEKKTSAVVPFSSLNEDKLDAFEYNTVTIRGSFLPGKQLLLGPRSLHDPSAGDKQEGGGLISRGSHSGFNIITPFKVAGQDTILLVNRGWIPNKNIEQYQIDPSKDEVIEIAGVVRKGEKRSQFMSKTQPGSTIWLYRDVQSMADILGTSEIFVDLTSGGPEAGGGSSQSLHSRSSNYPIPGQTRVTLRNEHVSYFLTWFSLSGITGYLWFRQFKQRLPLK